jgi:palmitoyltransferase
MKHEVEKGDNFGQSALHLATIRGNLEVVEYLLLDCHVDISKKDRNGQSALDLAVKKGQFNVEFFIRKLASRNICSLLTYVEIFRAMGPKSLSLILFGANDKERSNWPWRVVFLSNFIGSLVTISFITNESLGDLYYLHLLNSILQVFWWVCFLMCLFKSPSFVRDEGDLYKKALNEIGNSLNGNDLPSICHSCRVRRPLRSKHCKLQRRCVQKFDHFCPFVGNTVGRDNYCYFYSLLIMHSICGILWEITAIYLVWRVKVSWMFIFFMLYSMLWMFVIFGLLNYHTQLISNNMTTNEHINAMKYAYMKSVYGTIDCPFDRKSAIANCYDGFFPHTKNYYSRADVRADIDNKKAVDSYPLLV